MLVQNSPMSAKEVLDLYFIENRSRVLEIAAFLDRIDRTENSVAAKADFRFKAFIKSLKLLTGAEGWRTKNILLNFSDLSTEPIESAADLKGASGAWDKAVYED